MTHTYRAVIETTADCLPSAEARFEVLTEHVLGFVQRGNVRYTRVEGGRSTVFPGRARPQQPLTVDDLQERAVIAHLRGWCHDGTICVICDAQDQALAANRALNSIIEG